MHLKHPRRESERGQRPESLRAPYHNREEHSIPWGGVAVTTTAALMPRCQSQTQSTPQSWATSIQARYCRAIPRWVAENLAENDSAGTHEVCQPAERNERAL